MISISGFDIGCGNMAVRLDTPFIQIESHVGTIIKDVHKVISFGVGRTNDERVEHELFDDDDAWRESDMASYRQKAVSQLGTVGSGNHYVDLLRDEGGICLDRRAFRQPRPRPYQRDALSQGRRR